VVVAAVPVRRQHLGERRRILEGGATLAAEVDALVVEMAVLRRTRLEDRLDRLEDLIRPHRVIQQHTCDLVIDQPLQVLQESEGHQAVIAVDLRPACLASACVHARLPLVVRNLW
jgi:hypothetical protein